MLYIPRYNIKNALSHLAIRQGRRAGLAVAALVIAATGALQTVGHGTASALPSEFVYRRGTELMLNGFPYQFVGFNAFGMTGCEGAAWTNAQLDSYFSSLPRTSMTRLWAFRPYGTAALDRIVASAEAHNQKLILSLGNDLADCDSDGNKTQTWYQSGYTTTYLPWVKSTVARYKNSPAVGMWEIINEQGISINNANNANHLDTAVAKKFLGTVAATIKSIDPNHLVESGAVAEYVYSGGAADYQAVHDDPNIDVGSLHEYDYDYSNGQIISNHLYTTKAAMTRLNKPIIVGETGVMAGPSVTGSCHTTYDTRANVFKQKITGYMNMDISGVLIWDRTMRDVVDCSDFYVGPGDPTISIVQHYLVRSLRWRDPRKTIPRSLFPLPVQFRHFRPISALKLRAFQR